MNKQTWDELVILCFTTVTSLSLITEWKNEYELTTHMNVWLINFQGILSVMVNISDGG